MKDIIKIAIINALATVAYIALVASFLFHTEEFFGGKETILIPIIMLTLFVFSAAVTGLLVFGRPIIWFLEGRKVEALKLILGTLASFFVILIIAIFTLFIYNNINTKAAFFRCEEGKSVKARFNLKEDKEVTLFLSDGRVLTLPHTVSASGAKYEDIHQQIVFLNKGNTAFITEGKDNVQTFSNCLASES